MNGSRAQTGLAPGPTGRRQTYSALGPQAGGTWRSISQGVAGLGASPGTPLIGTQLLPCGHGADKRWASWGSRLGGRRQHRLGSQTLYAFCTRLECWGSRNKISPRFFFLGLAELPWIPAPILQMSKLRPRQGPASCCGSAQQQKAPCLDRHLGLLGSGGSNQCPRGELSGGLKCGLGLSARWADAGTDTRALNIHSLDRTLIKQSKVHYYLIKFFIGSLIGLLVAP